jgi:hypothetical protein
MTKVELFDIRNKKSDQRQAEMAMKPIDRLYLCLDLMDVSAALSQKNQQVQDNQDDIPWIILSMKNAKCNS